MRNAAQAGDPREARAEIIAAFRRLDGTDLDAVHALRDEVLSRLPHHDLYVPHEDESSFVRAHLGEAGESLGLEVGGRLVGYCALSLDPARACLDRAFLDRIGAWCAAARLSPDRCGVLAVTMLLPEYTGVGLHREAIDRRLARARELRRTRIFAMVSPHNRACLANLAARGLRVVDTIAFADGRVRRFLTGPAPRS